MAKSVSSKCCNEKLTCELPSEKNEFNCFTSELNTTSVMKKDLVSSTESLKPLNLNNAPNIIDNEENAADKANDKSNLTETDESLGILPDLLKDLTSDLDFLSFDLEDKKSLPVVRSAFFDTEDYNFGEDKVAFNAASDAFCCENNVKNSASDFDSPTWSEEGLSIYASTPKHELANEIFEGTICGSPAFENSNDSMSIKSEENGNGMSEPLVDFNKTVVNPFKNPNLESIPCSETETELKKNQFLNLNETKNLSLSQSEDEIRYSDWISELKLKYSDTLNLNRTQTLKSNPDDNSNPIVPNTLRDKLPIQTSNKRENMQSELQALCILDSTMIMPQAFDNTFVVKAEKPVTRKTLLTGNKKSFNLKQNSKTTQSNLLEPMNLSKTVKKSISLPPERKLVQFQGRGFQKTSSNAHVLSSGQCLTAVKLKGGENTHLKNESKANLRRLSHSGVENKKERCINLNSTITLSSTTRGSNSKNLGESKASLKAFTSNSIAGQKKANTSTIKPSAALNSTVCSSSKGSSFGNSEKYLPLSLTTERKNPLTCRSKGVVNLANGRMKLVNERAKKKFPEDLNTEMNLNETLKKPEELKAFKAACNSTFSSDELKSLVTADSSKACQKRNSTSGLKPRNSVGKSVSFPAVKKDTLNKSITNNFTADLQNKEGNSVSKRKPFDVPIIKLKNKGVDKKNKNSDCCIDSSKKASLHPKDSSNVLSRSSQRKSFSNNKLLKPPNPEALGMKPSNTLPVAKATKLVQEEKNATFISEAKNLEQCDTLNVKFANENGDNAKSNNLDKEENDLHKTGAIPKILKFRSSRAGKVVSSIPGASRGLPRLSTNLDGIKKIGHVISGKLKSPSKFKRKPLF